MPFYPLEGERQTYNQLAGKWSIIGGPIYNDYSRLAINLATAVGFAGFSSRSFMKTQGEIEAAVCTGMVRFEQDYMGRGPRTFVRILIGDLLVVRLIGVLTAADSICQSRYQPRREEICSSKFEPT